jgi:hypothetical protein
MALTHERDNTNRHRPNEPLPASPMGHRLLFVALTVLAFLLFSPSVVFPLLQQYGKTLEEEARLIRLNDEFEREVERRENLLDAFANDVTINERLAVLDLRYENPEEEILTVLPETPSTADSSAAASTPFQSELRIPATWPRRIRSAEAWAQHYGLIDLFLDPTLQLVFLFMSGGLIIAAFVLFAPRREQRRPGDEPPVHNQPATVAIHRPSA